MSLKKLFVGNLPYSTTDGDLEKAFREFGEIRACFTVKEPGVAKKCKGYGYVIFTTRESCEKAKVQVKVIGGRPVVITLAKTKVSKSGGSHLPEKEATQDGSHGTGSDSDEDDYEALTAKRVGGSGYRKPKSQRNQARFDIGRAVVLQGLPDGTTKEDLQGVCQVAGEVETITVLREEDGSIRGQILFQNHKQARSAVHKLQDVEVGGVKVEAALLSKANKKVSQKTLKKSRLIVRNLSFKCDEKHLEEVFSKYGHVREVKIPRKENGYMLGYAFVQFSSYFDAARARGEVNSQQVKGRPVAVDWVVPKDVYEQSVNKLNSRQSDTVSHTESTATEDAAASDSEQSDDGEEGIESMIKEEAESMIDWEAESTIDEEEESMIDETESIIDEEAESSNHESHDSTDEEKESDVKTSDVTEGKTLFIRCLPVDAGYKELSKLFSQFGPLRYCRVLKDNSTGLSRGTAFLQFKDKLSAQTCLESSNNEGLHFHGNKLVISMAVTKEEAKGFKGQTPSVKEDKRNLYLAKEGLILPGSEAAKHLSKVDMARRAKSYSERKSKLANPNYFVSKTRLSVRNLPTGVDDTMLKRVFSKAIGSSSPKITQVKILRAVDKVDIKGLGRSKGYGFVELSSHEDALNTLRATNNNPALFGERKRLIVEFAVENSKVINLRAQRKQRQLNSQGQRSFKETKSTETVQTDPVNSNPSMPFSKRHQWRLKWKTRRLAKKANSKVTTNNIKERRKTSLTNVVSESTKKRSQSIAQRNMRVNKHIPKSDAGSKEITSDGMLVKSSVKVKGRRKRSQIKAEEEESSFDNMVNKYRQRLDRFSSSRWLN